MGDGWGMAASSRSQDAGHDVGFEIETMPNKKGQLAGRERKWFRSRPEEL